MSADEPETLAHMAESDAAKPDASATPPARGDPTPTTIRARVAFVETLRAGPGPTAARTVVAHRCASPT